MKTGRTQGVRMISPEFNVKSLDELFSGITLDKIGVIKLDEWKDTPLWEHSRSYMPEAKSVIVIAMEVFGEVVKYLTSRRLIGEMAMRNLFTRSVNFVTGHMDWEAYKIIKRLHALGYRGLPFTAADYPVDARFLESAFSYKYAAKAAGLGVIGWHSMILTPEYGPRIRLAAIVTDAPLEPTATHEQEYPCLQCGGACVKICPAYAIRTPAQGEEYSMNKHACNTYLNASGGCAECLRVCPVAKAVE